MQVPTSLAGPGGSPTLLTNQTLDDCANPPNAQRTNWCGQRWCASYTVLDQNKPATQIKSAGLAFDETLSVTDTNVGLSSQSASGATDSSYTLYDLLAFGQPNKAVPAGSYAYTLQTIKYRGTGNTVRVNCLMQTGSTETVTDITANPSVPCHH